MSTYVNDTMPGHPITISELAIAYPGALAVFKRYNIDFCCGGHESLEETCLRMGLDISKVKAEILQAPEREAEQTLHADQWSSSFLIEFIVRNHHAYIKHAIPEIKEVLDKVCNAHGEGLVELLSIRDAFSELAQELTDHMVKEELVLFPAIRRIESGNIDLDTFANGIQMPIAAMEYEHVIAGDLIKHIRALSNNYTPPQFACPTFVIAYRKLQQFDEDLMQHVHLENNMLFKKYKESTITQ